MQKFIIFIGLLVLLAGCTYKMDIQQGNVVSEERLAKLKIGMDTKQVRFIMGPPLLTDPFHANRWDYYYSLKQQGEQTERYQITLYFEQEKLARIVREGSLPEYEHPGDKVRQD